MRRAFEMWMKMVGCNISQAQAQNGQYVVTAVQHMWRAWMTAAFFALRGQRNQRYTNFEMWVSNNFGNEYLVENEEGEYIMPITAWMWLAWKKSTSLAYHMAVEHAIGDDKAVADEALSIVKEALSK